MSSAFDPAVTAAVAAGRTPQQLAGFCNTLAPPDTRVRAVRRYQKPVATVKDATARVGVNYCSSSIPLNTAPRSTWGRRAETRMRRCSRRRPG